MDNLGYGIFIVPAIALTLVIVSYIYFHKRVADRQHFKYFVVTVAITAFLLNFIWELAQGPLYKGYQYDLSHISFCALASVADMFMVFVLLFGFGLLYKNAYWVNHMTLGRALLLMLAGGTGAILAEIRHTARSSWTYAESMPLLPWVEVGLSPVLQFTILPLLIFFISRKISATSTFN